MKKLVFVAFFIIIIAGVIVLKYHLNVDNLNVNVGDYEEKIDEEEVDESYEIYLSCMSNAYVSDNTLTQLDELGEYYSSYDISIYFTEINNNYTYTLNETKSYYAASITKLLLASYLIQNARSGDIDLSTTLTLTTYTKRPGSEYMQYYSIGDKVSIEDLIYYSISASDNSAYYMLMSYVTPTVLNEYAYTLNINLILSNNDYYGYTTSTNTNIYLQNVYNLIQINDEYTTLLINSMNNTTSNYLNFDDIIFLHKYGYYGLYFNDIGIYNDSDYPYLISILTYNVDYKTLINEISKNIYDIYYNNLLEKEEYCLSLVQ